MAGKLRDRAGQDKIGTQGREEQGRSAQGRAGQGRNEVVDSEGTIEISKGLYCTVERTIHYHGLYYCTIRRCHHGCLCLVWLGLEPEGEDQNRNAGVVLTGRGVLACESEGSRGGGLGWAGLG